MTLSHDHSTINIVLVIIIIIIIIIIIVVVVVVVVVIYFFDAIGWVTGRHPAHKVCFRTPCNVMPVMKLEYAQICFMSPDCR